MFLIIQVLKTKIKENKMSCLAREQAHHHQELPRSLGVIGAMPGKDFCIVNELGWTDS